MILILTYCGWQLCCLCESGDCLERKLHKRRWLNDLKKLLKSLNGISYDHQFHPCGFADICVTFQHNNRARWTSCEQKMSEREFLIEWQKKDCSHANLFIIHLSFVFQMVCLYNFNPRKKILNNRCICVVNDKLSYTELKNCEQLCDKRPLFCRRKIV